MSQKEVVKYVDIAASRAHDVEAEPATGKQCWFLAGLIVKADDEAMVSDLVLSTVLTKRYASKLIDSYMTA